MMRCALSMSPLAAAGIDWIWTKLERHTDNSKCRQKLFAFPQPPPRHVLHYAACLPIRVWAGTYMCVYIAKVGRSIEHSPLSNNITHHQLAAHYHTQQSPQHATSGAQPRRDADVPVGANAAWRRAEPSPSARVDIIVEILLAAVLVRWSMCDRWWGRRRAQRRRGEEGNIKLRPLQSRGRLAAAFHVIVTDTSPPSANHGARIRTFIAALAPISTTEISYEDFN